MAAAACVRARLPQLFASDALAERAPYEAQVRGYADVLRAIRRENPVRVGLVTADGTPIEVLG